MIKHEEILTKNILYFDHKITVIYIMQIKTQNKIVKKLITAVWKF